MTFLAKSLALESRQYWDAYVKKASYYRLGNTRYDIFLRELKYSQHRKLEINLEKLSLSLMINTPFDKCGLEGENGQTLKQDQNYVYLFQNKLCDLYMCHEQLLFLSKPAQTFKELLTFWLFSLFGLPQLDFKVNNSQFL